MGKWHEKINALLSPYAYFLINSLLKKYKPSDINPHIETVGELEKMYNSFPSYDLKIRKYGLIVIGLEN